MLRRYFASEYLYFSFTQFTAGKALSFAAKQRCQQQVF